MPAVADDAGRSCASICRSRIWRRQFAAYLGTPTRARGYPPIEGEHALIVEVAPALAIERVIDLALKAVPEVEPGIHYVERQFGVLEVHASDPRRRGAGGAGDPRGDRRASRATRCARAYIYVESSRTSPISTR